MKATMIDDSIINFDQPAPQRPFYNPAQSQQRQPLSYDINNYQAPQPKYQNMFKTGTNPHDGIRKAVAELFKGFHLTKTQQFDDPTFGKYGIYKARVSSLTIGPSKYIVAFVPNDTLPVGSTKMIQSLAWNNFQARETQNPLKEFNGLQLQEQFFQVKEHPILLDRINFVKESKYSYVYKAENLPLKIELIPTKEDETFAQSGTVLSAIDLFTTSVTLE